MKEIKFLNNIRNPYYQNISQGNAETQDKISNDTYIQEIYLNKLLEQYKKATGTTNIDLNSPEFIIDFNNWITRNKAIGDIVYLNFLEDLGLFFDKKNCAEIGKGIRDSLVLSYETTIITPYTNGIQNRMEGKTIDSLFTVENGVPIIYEKDEIVPETIIKPTEIDTFMTHNPYIGTNINSWVHLHRNNAYAGIILGVFGKKYDKDMDDKIKELIKLRALLEDDYIYDEYSFGDTYCHVLATDTVKKKKLIKAKTDNQ